MMTPTQGYQAVVAAINCCEVSPCETIAIIQLDAYKAGMRKAAEIARARGEASDEMSNRMMALSINIGILYELENLKEINEH